MIKVKRKWIKNLRGPPCCGHYEYTSDEGDTWMNEKEYWQWKQSIVVEEW